MRCQSAFSKWHFFSSLLIVGAPGTKSTWGIGTGARGQRWNVAEHGKTVAARVS